MMRAKAIASFLALWLVVGALVLLQAWPHVPTQWREISLILAFGPPVYGLLEWLGSWVLSEKNGNAISPRRFSPLRLLVTFIVAAAWFAIAGWFATSMPH
jgi:hypothetical protein